jgi:hypothetical protein
MPGLDELCGNDHGPKNVARRIITVLLNFSVVDDVQGFDAV